MLRYFLLATQYRGPLDFSDHAISEAKQALDGFYDLFQRLSEVGESATDERAMASAIDHAQEAFRQAMDDDFNTPVAIAALQKLRSDVNKLLEQGLSTEARKIAREEFRSLGDCLGLFQLDNWRFHTVQLTGVAMAHSKIRGAELNVRVDLTDSEIEGKVSERNEARKQKDFKKADEIRQFLASHGIVIEDKPDGTSRWKR
jgi:cysteinyl-tRNA synthetase